MLSLPRAESSYIHLPSSPSLETPELVSSLAHRSSLLFLLLAAAAVDNARDARVVDDVRVFLEATVIIVFSVFVEFGVLAFILEPEWVFLEATVIIVFSVQWESGVLEPKLLLLVLLEAVVIPLSSVRAELGVLCTVLATEEIAFVRE